MASSKPKIEIVTEWDVINIISQSLHLTGVEKQQITMDADFVKDLGADSLDCIEMRMKLEETFGIEISDGDETEIKTARQALVYITNKLKK